MAKSIPEALAMFQRHGFKDVISMSLDNNQTTYHAINHRFREEIIVPFIGLTQNIDFCMSKGDKIIRCADGVEAKVLEWKDVHICELEKDIQELYHIDAWAFLKRWWTTEKRMDSMTFIKMKLEKL